jgi:chorismate synthase
MIKLTTAGESHGKALTSILEGMPAGLPINIEYINKQLTRRRLGYGRGGRMKIEDDKAQILSGIRDGATIGSPICLMIENKDYSNWVEKMSAGKVTAEKIVMPRPGHADLVGLLKTNQDDIRNILERSSARETAARVAASSVCRRFLEELGVKVMSQVTCIGKVKSSDDLNINNVAAIDESPLRMADKTAEKEAIKAIDEAAQKGETLGGTFVVGAFNAIAGLGSYVSWEERLDGKLAQAILSIPAIKGVSFGKGFDLGELSGSKAHDEIYYDNGYYRKTNRAGGLEGGMTNGEPLIINAVMKPIPTLGSPLQTVNMETKKATKAFKERADVTAVPAAAVIAESMVCLILAGSYIEKFGSDSLADLKANIDNYQKRLK